MKPVPPAPVFFGSRPVLSHTGWGLSSSSCPSSSSSLSSSFSSLSSLSSSLIEEVVGKCLEKDVALRVGGAELLERLMEVKKTLCPN
mmetsp:Transcript_12068/g.18403  ORF Transcript_12068/g.18403 Transcript_12068/m.18403 type:complete len:87 (+) Transcript_12068:83-343(+)